ncbi:hypothetical protein D9M68_800200 [compost metagenome]
MHVETIRCAGLQVRNQVPIGLQLQLQTNVQAGQLLAGRGAFESAFDNHACWKPGTFAGCVVLQPQACLVGFVAEEAADAD